MVVRDFVLIHVAVQSFKVYPVECAFQSSPDMSYTVLVACFTREHIHAGTSTRVGD